MDKVNFAKPSVLLTIIIAISAVLRFYNIDKLSLWHDEAFSALLIRYPYGEMINRIILDVHPPFYYIMLRIWDLFFGDNLITLRLFSAFFGILTVYFSYLFIKSAFKDEKLSLIAAALVAVNPFQIQYSTEARMYTLGTFLIVLSSWILIKALESKSEGLLDKQNDWLSILAEERAAADSKLKRLIININKYRWWVLYGIISAFAIYTHYYLIFSVAAQAFFVLFWAFINYKWQFKSWIEDKNIKGAFAAYVITFILFLPWLAIFLKQLGQVEKNYWIPEMNNYSIPNTIFHLFSGTNIYTSNPNLIIFFLAFIAIFAISFKNEKNSYKWLIAFSFFVPFAISIALSFKRSLYLDRYFVFVGLFYVMIISSFVSSIKKNIAQKIIIILLLIGNVLFFARGWQKLEVDNKPGMAGASKYLFDNAKPEDNVFVNSSFIYFTYKYYAFKNFFPTGYPSNFNPSVLSQEKNMFAEYSGNKLYPEYLTPLLYTPGLENLNQIPHFSGTALLTDFDLLKDFNINRKRGEIVWLVWTTGFGSGKPEIPVNWKQIDEKGFQDVFDYRGWIVVTKYQIQ